VNQKQKGLGINQVPVTTKQSLPKYCITQTHLHVSKRDLVINQVPITTNPSLSKYCIATWLLAVTLNIKEESPYKPERLKGSYQPKYTQRRSDIYLDLGQPLHNCPCKAMARYMSSLGICRLPCSESKTEE